MKSSRSYFQIFSGNNVTFNLTSVADQAHLASLATGQLQLISDNNSFENTTFATPAGNLTINAGDGNDRLALSNSAVTELTRAGTPFTGTLSLNGENGDDTFGITNTNGLNLNIDGGPIGTTGNILQRATVSNEVQTATLTNAPTGGTFTLTFNGQTTIPLPLDSSAATVQTALQALPTIGSGNATVARSPNEIETVTLANATGGTFTLSFTGTFANTVATQTTSPIVFNASTAEVQSALQALPGIGAGNVTVQQDTNGKYVITFQGALGNQDIRQLTADASGLTGAGPTVTVSTTGSGNIGNNGYSTAQGGSVYTITFTGALEGQNVNQITASSSLTGTTDTTPAAGSPAVTMATLDLGPGQPIRRRYGQCHSGYESQRRVAAWWF